MTVTANGAELAVAGPALAGICREFEHVLTGVVLDEMAARLARMLDRAFLAEAGWDPVARVLSLPAGHRLLGRAACRAGGCTTTVHTGLGGVCYRCFTRLTGLGLTGDQIAAMPQLPPLPDRVTECAVPGCRCEPTVAQAILCEPHAPPAAYAIIGALHLAASRLGQLFSQITRYLHHALAAGRLGHDLGEDPAFAVEAAAIFLSGAAASAAALAGDLGAAWQQLAPVNGRPATQKDQP